MIPSRLQERLQSELDARRQKGLLRSLSPWKADSTWLNLADNDYLRLAQDPAVVAAAREAADAHGCSSSASPLISGFRPPHERLEQRLKAWHGFPSGLVCNSGYAANQAVLGRLPRKGDIVFADRFIHNSMISGILQSGARLVRYRHNDIDHLRELLREHDGRVEGVSFVVTESIFSMDGDAPDLAAIVDLKDSFAFCLVVDEAHATGWHGPNGAGLAAETHTTGGIDVLVGTLGKALGSQGAYTLFHDEFLRDYLVNHAGEFIYSTYLTPIAAAAAVAAIERVHELSSTQNDWRKVSRTFREELRSDGWIVPQGDSPIVPVMMGESEDALAAGAFFRERKVLVGAIRPPTVPAGSSRLRFSLNRHFTSETATRIQTLLNDWRAQPR